MSTGGIATLGRRLLALGLLAAVLAGVYALAIVPVQARFDEARTRIEAARTLIGRLEREIAARQEDSRSPPPAAMAATAARVYLDGESDALKGAHLLAILKAAAETQGVRLASTRALPPRPAGEVRVIGMEARFDASMAALQRLLVALERHTPLVLIDTLVIAPEAGRLAMLGETGDSDKLNVTLAAYGAAGPRAGEPTAGSGAGESPVASPDVTPEEAVDGAR